MIRARPLPHRFYGTATLDGAALSVGSAVTATVGGDAYSTTTDTSGNYVLTVASADITKSYAGQTVTFSVRSYAATQTATWTAGGVTNLNLTARTAPPGPAPIRYYSCFIAYGTPVKVFAEKLCEDLTARGVSRWLFDSDAPVGGSVWGEIRKARGKADRVIVTCSAASLGRDGLLKELEDTADEDPSKLVPISLDNIWREKGFRVQRGERDLKPFLENQIYADFVGWEKDEKIYQKGLEKLLRGLQREKGAKGG